MAKEVFLDTCVLTNIFIYLDFAVHLNLPPYIKDELPVSRVRNIIKEKTINKSVSDAIIHEAVKGFNALCYLRDLSNESKIYYSQLSENEMIYSALEQQMYWYLLKKGIGYSVRKNLLKNAEGCPQTKVLLSRARPSYAVRRVKGYILHLQDLLQPIPIIITERTIQNEEITELYSTLIEEILIEVIDGLLFSQALLVQVDEFLTYDDGLRNTVANLRQGGTNGCDINWEQSQKSIREKISQLIGATHDKVMLPKGLKPIKGNDPVLKCDVPCFKGPWKYA